MPDTNKWLGPRPFKFIYPSLNSSISEKQAYAIFGPGIFSYDGEIGSPILFTPNGSDTGRVVTDDELRFDHLESFTYQIKIYKQGETK